MLKLLKVLLGITVLLGLVSQAQAATIAVGSVGASPGETILVPVNIDSMAGQASCSISVAFDSHKLRLLGKENGNIGAGIMGPKLTDANKRGKYDPIVSFLGGANAGTIMYLKFAVREGVKGDCPLTLTVPTPAGIFKAVNGKIMVR
jgi:hypothetical protein